MHLQSKIRFKKTKRDKSDRRQILGQLKLVAMFKPLNIIYCVCYYVSELSVNIY